MYASVGCFMLGLLACYSVWRIECLVRRINEDLNDMQGFIWKLEIGLSKRIEHLENQVFVLEMKQ